VTHDLVVVGAGPGGYVAAIRAAQLGMRVAVVEREPALGGTCLRIGCIPSKALLESSELYAEARERLEAHGIRARGVELDLPAMLRRKDDVVRVLTKGVDALFRKHGVARHQGHGRLVGPGRVAVEGGPEPRELSAPRVLLATGSAPAPLRGVEPDGDRVGTSTEALAYPEVPRHLVVIGGGYIGLELGSVWRRLGAEVTVLEVADRILPGMDAELAAGARKLLEAQGLRFRLGARVVGARADGEGAAVELEDGQAVRGDRVLLAVGRVPFTGGLGLEAVGLAPDGRGRVPVDARFATAAPGVFAIGDVVRGPMLAHKAMDEGVACAEALAGGAGHVDYDTIPSVVYTAPEIASVGRTEEDLRAAGVAYRKGSFPFRGNGRARTLGRVDGWVKVLADERTDRVLGVHVLGPRAGDLVAEATAAMAFGASSEDLARTCHAHPTLAEALREAALAVDGRALHA
jgi:dihydrolipoamide dehydrogenase